MIDVPHLVELEDARNHLRETSAIVPQDVEIQAKLAQATAFVLRACGALADDTWTASTVPAPVHTAILVHLAELYTDRGDVERKDAFGHHAILYLMAAGYRDPVVA